MAEDESRRGSRRKTPTGLASFQIETWESPGLRNEGRRKESGLQSALSVRLPGTPLATALPDPGWHCPQGPPHPHAPPLCLGRRLGSTSSKGARGRRQKHTDEVISQVAGFLTRMAPTCQMEMVNGSPLWGRAAIHLRSLHSECLRFPLGRPLERLHPD